jgi:DNA-binding SARP family transcriptional activator
MTHDLSTRRTTPHPFERRKEGGSGEGATVEDVLGHISLLGQFELRVHGVVTELPLGAQRLLALLALWGTLVRRPLVAGTLWPEKGDGRAIANLRSSLWRVGQVSPSLVRAADGCLALARRVSVDTVEMLARARRLQGTGDDCRAVDLDASLFRQDLLPGWYDDWALLERERIRQARLHALEALCEHLIALGRYPEAIDSGLLAVAAEPLRESAHRALMRAYQAEGNRSEALRAYENLRQLLQRELGVEPSFGVEDLMLVQAAPRTPDKMNGCLMPLP